MGILPPGFRFHPTDVELVMYYLKRKVMKKKFQFEAMAELNVYKYEPWDLADKSLLRRDLEWYFFSPRERKYGSGARTNRATETGYWKATGKDRAVIYNNRTVGMIKTLIFYKGHAPKGERTDWVMHEYRIEDKNLSDIGIIQDSYVICKIFQKSGLGPKNGAQYGAPFSEEEWNEVESAEEESPLLTEHLQPSNHRTAVSLAGTTTSCSMTMSKVVQCPTQALVINQPCSTADPSDSDVSWLPICTDVAKHSIENYTTENTHLLKSPEGAQGITRVAFSEEVSNAREICAIPSPVNGQVLSVHSPYRDLDYLGALNSNVPGTTSGWPVSELGLQGQSAPSTLVTNMPYDLPEDDITALLSMFREDSSMVPVENNEHFNTVHTDQSGKAQVSVDKNSIFSGLGDLNNLGELRKSGFDFSNTCVANYTPNTMLLDDDMIFLELKDLDSPLNNPAEAMESVRRPSDSSYSPYNCFHNMDGSFCVSNIPNSVQNFSRLNSTSFPPEGPCWMQDIVGVSRKGPDIQNLENYGSDTFMGNNIPSQISRRQPEGSSSASQIQRRGTLHRKFRLQFSLESIYALLSVAELFAHIIAAEKLNDSRSCGSSTIYFKAEVALKVGECTEDALSHDMGESNCMCCCWGNLPKNKLEKNNLGLRFEIVSYQWIVTSLLRKIIVRRTYLINMIINWLILHPRSLLSCCPILLRVRKGICKRMCI